MSYLKYLTLIAIISLLTACGGGGGGGGGEGGGNNNGNDQNPADTTPNGFSFTDATDVDLLTEIESNAITVSGINAATAISISGGEYSINGGAYTSTAGTVSNNQQVKVRQISSDQFSQQINVVLTIGGVSDTFSFTTLAEDTVPETFTFPDITNADRNIIYVSQEVSISGINFDAPISAVNGEYSIDGAEFTAQPGIVQNGQAMRVRIVSSNNFSETVTATINVGGVTEGFNVTTLDQDTTPNSFNFSDLNDVALSAELTSNGIVISGIDGDVPISVVNGEYSIDNGPFTGNSGTIQNNQQVRARHISASTYSTVQNTTLFIGGINDIFSSVTISSPGSVSDTMPNPFSFADLVDVARDQTTFSSPITITGIDSLTPISISGGEYSVDGGAYTTANGFITNSQQVTIQITSSSAFQSTVNATLNIGGVTDIFSVTTWTEDTTPNSFSFITQSDVQLNTPIFSSTAVVSGINNSTPVSISGGEYSIDGGVYTSGPGTINNGQSLTIRQISASTFDSTTTSTITVGGVLSVFTTVTRSPNTTPDDFSFINITNAELATLYLSNSEVISGIESAVPVSVSSAEYSIDGGAFTSAQGLISDGQAIVLRVVSSDQFSTPIQVGLTVSDVTKSFTITTQAVDQSPEPIIFPTVSEVSFTNQVVSNEESISGINTPIPISISGGEYSIDGGVFTDSSGMVSSGQKIRLQVLSGSVTSSTSIASVQIGDYSTSFHVVTVPTDPYIKIEFPKSISLTEDQFEFVRGKVIASNSISSVTVNGVDATSADNFENWETSVTLNSGANVLLAKATDSNGENDSDTVTITRSFKVGSIKNIVVSDDGNTIYGWENDLVGNMDRMIAVDRATTLPQVISENDPVNTGDNFIFVDDMKLDSSNNRILVFDMNNLISTVKAVDIDTGARTILFQDTNPINSNTSGKFTIAPYGGIPNPTNSNELLFMNLRGSTSAGRALMSLNLSDYSIDELYNYNSTDLSGINGLMLNPQNSNQLILLTDPINARLSVIDLTTYALSDIPGASSISESTDPVYIGPYPGDTSKILLLDNLAGMLSVDLSDGSVEVVAPPYFPGWNKPHQFIENPITSNSVLLTINKSLIELNLQTGVQTELRYISFDLSDTSHISSLAAHPSDSQSIILSVEGNLYAYNVATDTLTLMSAATDNPATRLFNTENTQKSLSDFFMIDPRGTGNIIVYSLAHKCIIEISSATGQRTRVLGTEVNGVDDALTTGYAAFNENRLAYDPALDRIIISSRTLDTVFSHNLIDNTRNILFSGATADYLLEWLPSLNNVLVQSTAKGIATFDDNLDSLRIVGTNYSPRIGNSIDRDYLLYYASAGTADPNTGNSYFTDYDYSGGSMQTVKVDFQTGDRSVLSSYPRSLPLSSPGHYWNLAFDKNNSETISIQGYSNSIVSTNVNTGQMTFSAINSTPSVGNKLPSLADLFYDPYSNLLYAVGTDWDQIISIDSETGERQIISSNAVGNGVLLGSITAILNHPSDPNKLLVFDKLDNAIVEVDKITGNRSVISDVNVGTGPMFQLVGDRLITSPNKEEILVVDTGLAAVISVNLDSGNRLVISDASISPQSLINNYTGSGTVNPIDENQLLLAGKISAGAGLHPVILSIDLTTGAQDIFVNDPPSVSFPLISPAGISDHPTEPNKILMYDSDPAGEQGILEIDLVSGIRRRISSGQVYNSFFNPTAIASKSGSDVIWVADSRTLTIYAIDLISGGRVYFSR